MIVPAVTPLSVPQTSLPPFRSPLFFVAAPGLEGGSGGPLCLPRWAAAAAVLRAGPVVDAREIPCAVGRRGRYTAASITGRGPFRHRHLHSPPPPPPPPLSLSTDAPAS